LTGKRPEKYASSLSFWILVVISVYFAYALYFAVYGFSFNISLISDHYVYNLLSKDPWWWLVLYYGTEGVTGGVAVVLRAFAGLFALYGAFLFWRKKDAAMPAIRKSASTALLLEAGFFLFLLPSVIAAVAYNLTSEYLFYFDHTPGLLLLYGTAIPCLAVVLVVPPMLLKLGAAIKRDSPKEEIIKWSCLTGVAYLFVVFWFDYAMMWADNMVPYPRSGQQYGISFLLQPANLLSFAVTVFGLLALAITALVSTLPAIRKQPNSLNLTSIGIVMTAFGSYFLFNLLYFYLTGGYEAHPSVWYEVIGPNHNPNLWGVAFIFIGLPVLIHSKIKKQDCKTN
jgi:hypothetical protein